MSGMMRRRGPGAGCFTATILFVVALALAAGLVWAGELPITEGTITLHDEPDRALTAKEITTVPIMIDGEPFQIFALIALGFQQGAIAETFFSRARCEAARDWWRKVADKAECFPK